MNGYYVSVDIGGTKTAIGFFDENLKLMDEIKMKSNPSNGCENLIDRIYDEAYGYAENIGIKKSEIKSIGLACPGSLDVKKGMIINIATMGWKDIPIKKMFEDKFSLPIFFENDANAAGLGEYFFGAGKGSKSMVYITVSTGIGGAIIIDDKLFEGAHYLAAELGHICVQKNGLPCGCEKKGCLELYASGTAMEEGYFNKTGIRHSAQEIAKLARNNNKIAKKIMKTAGEYIGLMVSYLYQIIDPEIVVIGGGVANDFDLLYEDIMSEARKNAIKPLRDKIKVGSQKLNGQQGLYGMATISSCGLKNIQ